MFLDHASGRARAPRVGEWVLISSLTHPDTEFAVTEVLGCNEWSEWQVVVRQEGAPTEFVAWVRRRDVWGLPFDRCAWQVADPNTVREQRNGTS